MFLCIYLYSLQSSSGYYLLVSMANVFIGENSPRKRFLKIDCPSFFVFSLKFSMRMTLSNLVSFDFKGRKVKKCFCDLFEWFGWPIQEIFMFIYLIFWQRRINKSFTFVSYVHKLESNNPIGPKSVKYKTKNYALRIHNIISFVTITIMISILLDDMSF